MERKIRVGAVSYLNTKPLIYGFEKGMMMDSIELYMDYPAKVAEALINATIDIGLVPVAIIPELKEYHIIGNHGIACDGPVASVCLFSEVPLTEIKTVLLDYQSRTSVILARVLMKEFWKISPVVLNAGNDFENQISGTTAAIVIGDRALKQRKQSTFIYDLGQAWKEYTGLPFVFAAWVSNKVISRDFIKEFNTVNEFGLQHVEEVIRLNPYPLFDLKAYYSEYILYNLSQVHMKGLELFLQKIRD